MVEMTGPIIGSGLWVNGPIWIRWVRLTRASRRVFPALSHFLGDLWCVLAGFENDSVACQKSWNDVAVGEVGWEVKGAEDGQYAVGLVADD